MVENQVELNRSNDKRKQEIREVIIQLFELKANKKRFDYEFECKKNKLTRIIESYMEINGHSSLNLSYKREVPDPKNKAFRNIVDQGLRVVKIVRRKIFFNADKLEEKLGKELCREFITRTYVINDWDAMVKLLKSKGIKANEFIKYVTVDKTVDTAKLEQMEALGDITKKELNGTYEVKILSSYLQIDAVKSR